MRVNNDDRGRGEQGAKAALVRQLAVIEETIPGVRQGVDRSLPAPCTILALQRIRGDIAAFEVALIEARLRWLAAGAPSQEERSLVSELAPLIARLAGERSRRQGRMKWSSN